jgi:DNA-binding NtrC family response regulator
MGRILVIDDEEGVRTAVKRRLEREGHEVQIAGSTHDAVRLIREEHPYDVIVTDMSMDVPKSGLEILQAAFSKDLFAEVIVMTAYGNVANAVESMRRGAFDYIEKNAPGQDAYEEITNKVEQAMDRRIRDIRTVELWERTAKVQEAAKSH